MAVFPCFHKRWANKFSVYWQQEGSGLNYAFSEEFTTNSDWCANRCLFSNLRIRLFTFSFWTKYQRCLDVCQGRLFKEVFAGWDVTCETPVPLLSFFICDNQAQRSECLPGESDCDSTGLSVFKQDCVVPFSPIVSIFAPISNQNILKTRPVST